MRHARRFGLAAAFALLALAMAVAQSTPRARGTALTDLAGATVRPLETRAVASVFVFARTDCPVTARYAPEIERLQRRAAADSMDFALIFVDPAESSQAIRAYLHDYGYTGRALRDPAHALVRLAGATTTPEAAVFVERAGEPALVYRGRIDDRYMDIGRVRPAPTRHDLNEVIEAVHAGRHVDFHSTPAVGCLIADVGR